MPILLLIKQFSLIGFRQYSLNTEWIIRLDSDEIIPSDLSLEIQEVISSGTDANAFSICRKMY